MRREGNNLLNLNFFYQGRMDICCGHSHYPLDTDGNTTIALDADDDAFHSFENAARDADRIALAQSGENGVQINNLLFIIARNGDEATHLGVGNDKGTVGFTIDDVTYGQRQTDRLLDAVDASQRGMDKNKVVNHRNQLAYLAVSLLHVLVMHRNEIFYIFGIKHFLQL